MQILRYAFAVLAILFMAGVVYQVFLAGMAVFGAGQWATHADFGYAVAWLPLLLLLLAWPSHVGPVLGWLSAGALLAGQVQTVLPWFRADVPWVAALHPVNAMIVFGLSVVIARRAVALARSGAGAKSTTREAVTAGG